MLSPSSVDTLSCLRKRCSPLKKSTDEFLGVRIKLFRWPIAANWSKKVSFPMFFFSIKLCNRVFQQAGWFVGSSATFLKTLYYVFVQVSFSIFLAKFSESLVHEQMK